MFCGIVQKVNNVLFVTFLVLKLRYILSPQKPGTAIQIQVIEIFGLKSTIYLEFQIHI